MLRELPTKYSYSWSSQESHQGVSLVKESAPFEIPLHQDSRLIITLLGKTGSGKGTVGEELKNRFKIAHISVGDLYRDALRKNGGLSKVIKFQAEQKISYDVDEICVGMLMMRLQDEDCQRGYILDGFPRTASQASVLRRCIVRQRDIHIPIELSVPDNLIFERLTKRFFCDTCNVQVRGHTISDATSNCPTCSTTLSKREDDKEVRIIQEKLQQHAMTRQDILATLGTNEEIDIIDIGDEKPQAVFEEVFQRIDARLDKVVVIKKSQLVRQRVLACQIYVSLLLTGYIIRKKYGNSGSNNVT